MSVRGTFDEAAEVDASETGDTLIIFLQEREFVVDRDSTCNWMGGATGRSSDGGDREGSKPREAAYDCSSLPCL